MSAAAAKFITLLYEMATNEENAAGVGFSADGTCLEIRDRDFLARTVLPRYFKHSMIQSLVRQLNNYSFISRPPTGTNVSQSFAHPCFLHNREDLLYRVKRKVPLAKDSAPESATTAATNAATLQAAEAASALFEAQEYNNLLHANQQIIQRNLQLQARIKQLEEEISMQASGMRFVQPNFLQHHHHHHQQQQQAHFYGGGSSSSALFMTGSGTSQAIQGQAFRIMPNGFGGIDLQAATTAAAAAAAAAASTSTTTTTAAAATMPTDQLFKRVQLTPPFSSDYSL